MKIVDDEVKKIVEKGYAENDETKKDYLVDPIKIRIQNDIRVKTPSQEKASMEKKRDSEKFDVDKAIEKMISDYKN